METCNELVIGWYPGKLPPYQVKFTTTPEAVVNVKTPATPATPATTAATTKGQIISEQKWCLKFSKNATKYC